MDRLKVGLDPEMAAALAKQAELCGGSLDPVELPTPNQRGAQEKRDRYWNEGGPEVARSVDRHIAGPTGPILVRFFYPVVAERLPVVLYIHGGGWTVGSLASNDRFMRTLAIESDAVVAGVEYALAPEHPYPTALNEVVAVIDWLTRHGEEVGIDSKRIGLAGASAGANLALAASMMLRDQGRKQICTGALYVGIYGLDLETASYKAFDETGYGPSRKRMQALIDLYAPAPTDRDDPYVTPLERGAFNDLPPFYICAANLDTLYEDSVALARRIGEAGGHAKLEVFEGVGHAFFKYGRMVSKGRQAIHSGGHFLAGHFATSSLDAAATADLL